MAEIAIGVNFLADRKHSSDASGKQDGDQSTVDLLTELGSNDDIEVILDQTDSMHKSSKKRRRDKHRNRFVQGPKLTHI